MLMPEEYAFYAELAEDMTNIAMPWTIVDRAFDRLGDESELIAAIGYIDTASAAKIITRGDDSPLAIWGALCGTELDEIHDGLNTEDIHKNKLSAYITACKAMLDHDENILDEYFVELLVKSIANALETAMINGDGINQPIGMTRDVDSGTPLGYDKKTPKPLTSMSAETMAKEILIPLTRGGTRPADEVLFVVNPHDYYSMIMPQVYGSIEGILHYIYNPLPICVIMSTAMEKGRMIAGLASDYLLFISGHRKSEHSDQFQFLEDNRIYTGKLYANGRPIDNDAFLYFDISAIDTEPLTIPKILTGVPTAGQRRDIQNAFRGYDDAEL